MSGANTTSKSCRTHCMTCSSDDSMQQRQQSKMNWSCRAVGADEWCKHDVEVLQDTLVDLQQLMGICRRTAEQDEW
jgi:hypothetical protein